MTASGGEGVDPLQYSRPTHEEGLPITSPAACRRGGVVDTRHVEAGVVVRESVPPESEVSREDAGNAFGHFGAFWHFFAFFHSLF